MNLSDLVPSFVLKLLDLSLNLFMFGLLTFEGESSFLESRHANEAISRRSESRFVAPKRLE